MAAGEEAMSGGGREIQTGGQETRRGGKEIATRTEAMTAVEEAMSGGGKEIQRGGQEINMCSQEIHTCKAETRSVSFPSPLVEAARRAYEAEIQTYNQANLVRGYKTYSSN